MEKFENRYFLYDYARSRSINKAETVKLLDVLKKAGYNGILLHLEGFFERKAFKGIMREGCITLEEAAWIKNEIKSRGMEVVPVVNLVGHAESFVYYQERFADMRRDNNTNQFSLFDDRLEDFAYKVIDELLEIYEPELLHIGGDECALNDQEKPRYVKFLSSLCDYVNSKNVTPCIWGDMLFGDQKLAEDFNKDVILFDWFYTGHRNDSLEFFKSKGFKDIFACNSDQGWDGFIGCNRLCPWPHALPKDQRPVACDEMEAFLDDAYNLDIKNGVVTDWENTSGHNLWLQMSAIVRCGLYMTGKDISEEAIEKTLFGRVTPFTKASVLLQELQTKVYDAALAAKVDESLFCRISDVVFNRTAFKNFILNSKVMAGNLGNDIVTYTDKVMALMDGWNANSDIEVLCKASIKAAADYALTSHYILKLGNAGYEAYHKAALLQFEDSAKASKELTITSKCVSELVKSIKEFSLSQSAAIAETGQTKRDMAKLAATADSLLGLKARIDGFATEILTGENTAYAIPSFRMLLNELKEF